MPLKHTTETLLIFLLGTLTVVTGVVIPTLTNLETGIVQWAIVFVLAAAYPLLLSQTFRQNRADYAFRVLHWMPAFLLLIVLLLELLVYAFPSTAFLLSWYAWGWTLSGVAIGFFLLGLFCLRVIRRWTLRIVLLSILFVPFVVGAVASEHFSWNGEIASVLWGGEWWQLAGGGSGSLLADAEEKNLNASLDPVEEQYRDRLRAIENRRERIAERLEERRNETFSVSSVLAINSSAPSVEMREVSSMPSHLPGAGFDWTLIILTLLGLYTAAVHEKTKQRVIC